MKGIKIENLHKSYNISNKSVEVLKGITFDAQLNKITMILGKSGCGKTTLLKILGGLEEKDQGTLEYIGDRKVSFVFQEPRLMPWLNVYQNIAFGLDKIDTKRELIEKQIEEVGLNGFEKAYPAQLSGGMQQRVAIARGLTFNPSFIMMDEPFAALDYFTRTAMQKKMIEIQKSEKCGILFVTHSIDEALLMGHEIIVIKDGKIKNQYYINEDNNRDLLDERFIDLKRKILKDL